MATPCGWHSWCAVSQESFDIMMTGTCGGRGARRPTAMFIAACKPCADHSSASFFYKNVQQQLVQPLRIPGSTGGREWNACQEAQACAALFGILDWLLCSTSAHLDTSRASLLAVVASSMGKLAAPLCPAGGRLSADASACLCSLSSVRQQARRPDPLGPWSCGCRPCPT